MAISKNLELKINNDQASFNEKFYVYQNDRGISHPEHRQIIPDL